MRLASEKIATAFPYVKKTENDFGSSANNLTMVAIENAASCNLKCKACPTVYASNYPNEFMSMETFERICDNVPDDIFPKRILVGYGEPFLDSSYFEKLKYLKKRGYWVGSATNFSLFNEGVVNKVIEGGLDQLNISMDASHFNASGSTFPQLSEKIKMLFKLRKARSSSLVIGVIIVAYKSSYPLVAKIIQLLKDYTPVIDIIPLMMIPSKDIYSESMSRREFLSFKEKVAEQFKDLDIYFDFALREDSVSGNCRANIFETAYINYRGEVSPCSMLAMEFPNVTFSGELGWMKPLIFGRLDQSDFESIWESEDYRYFRNQFGQGRLPQQCTYCNHWRKLS